MKECMTHVPTKMKRKHEVAISVPFKRKKVRICEIMSGGFAVKI